MITESESRISLIEPSPSREVAEQSQGAMTSPADLLRLAVSKGADLDQLERLMKMKLEWDREAARREYVAAMVAFKEEPLEIFKRKQVSFRTRDGDLTEYKHAELSDVTAAIVPALSKHGLSHRWDVRQEQAGITVDCVLTHRLGHSERVRRTRSSRSHRRRATCSATPCSPSPAPARRAWTTTGEAAGRERRTTPSSTPSAKPAPRARQR
jgi:hypothetical protein